MHRKHCGLAQNRRGDKRTVRRIGHKIPPPKGNTEGPLKALIIDSWFDNYLGVVSLVRIIDGQLELAKKLE